MPLKSTTYNRLAALALLAIASYYSSSAFALPSFARQTGESCTACHVQTWGADLTPRGRDFKLKAYTDEGATTPTRQLPALSVTAVGGGNLADYENASGYRNSNDNSFFKGSVFYAGKVYGQMGAYVEGTYVHDFDNNTDYGLNKVDIRIAKQADWAGHHLVYGVSANNEPGVQDLWNTNATWQPTLIGKLNGSILADHGLAGHTGGATLYAMFDNLLYVEAGAYASLANNVQNWISRPSTLKIDGAAPYWRIALQHDWNGHYLALGHFGLRADTKGDGFYNPTSASYSDLGVDASYQYLANPKHIVEFKGRYAQESRSQQFYDVYRSEATIDTFNLTGAYTWQQTVGLSMGYLMTRLAENATYRDYLKQDYDFLSVELAYTPFGKQSSHAAPWLNLRLNLSYTTELTHLKNPYQTTLDLLQLSGQLTF